MDRSQTTSVNHIENSEVLLTKHFLQIWGTKGTNLGNEKQFDSDKFKEFCRNICTKVAFVSVYHLESNRVMERANRIVFSAISKTLFNL
jgi:hypothetical protein